MILRTSGIGVSIAFLREAQWGSHPMLKALLFTRK